MKETLTGHKIIITTIMMIIILRLIILGSRIELSKQSPEYGNGVSEDM
jgi:hypothetical protein